MDGGWEQESTAEEVGRAERIKRLVLAAVSRCNACHRHYTMTDFAILGHRDHLWMLTIVCERCQNQGFVTAVVEGHHFESPLQLRRSFSELSPAERARFPNSQPVATDDLLDLHLFLDDFNGDFAGLFEREQGKA